MRLKYFMLCSFFLSFKYTGGLMKTLLVSLGFLIVVSLPSAAFAIGKQDYDDCRTRSTQTCERAGSCAVQSSAWYMYATVDKKEKSSKMGWPGLCDMAHVALVQGNCSTTGSPTSDVTAFFSAKSSALIPNISGGPLGCYTQ